MNKPNTQYYKGTDQYTDGGIEDIILEKLQDGLAENLILEDTFCFASYYHLSPIRQNLLSWYTFEPGSSVLEIGSGPGALSGLLARKVGDLTCVELSLKRSMINYHRNISRDNMEIIVGNIDDIPLTRRFDYVTLIGVLEYCRQFSDFQTPVDWLRRMRDLLNDSGKLILAIENKFGLKYFAGAQEDHIGKPFVGIEGYHGSKIQTYAKQEITDLLCAAGFQQPEFYFPFPDYKFPNQVFSEKSSDFYHLIGNYDTVTGYGFQHRNFSEYNVLRELIPEQQLPFFANSFLIFAERRD